MKFPTLSTCARALLLVTISLSGRAFGEDVAGAKALFCTDTAICATAATPRKHMKTTMSAPASAAVAVRGLSYWVEQEQASGELKRVSTTRTFTTGDRIRLSFRPNQKGHLYLFGLGTSGKTTPLFPKVAGETAGVDAGQTVSIPGRSFLRFDGQPGEELILAIFSPTPIAEYASPTIAQMTASDVTVLAETRSAGSKDLVRDDDFDGTQPTLASYAVLPSKTDSRAINLTIRLKHK